MDWFERRDCEASNELHISIVNNPTMKQEDKRLQIAVLLNAGHALPTSSSSSTFTSTQSRQLKTAWKMAKISRIILIQGSPTNWSRRSWKRPFGWPQRWRCLPSPREVRAQVHSVQGHQGCQRQVQEEDQEAPVVRQDEGSSSWVWAAHFKWPQALPSSLNHLLQWWEDLHSGHCVQQAEWLCGHVWRHPGVRGAYPCVHDEAPGISHDVGGHVLNGA